MNTAPVKTRDEIDDLKHQWLRDPAWDIEDTPGFEAYRDELAAFRRALTVTSRRAEWKRLREKADKLGCSVTLVKYLESLEHTVEQLQEFHNAQYYGEPIPTPFYPPRRSS